MNDGRSSDERGIALVTWMLLLAHAASLVALCWQQKLTPDEGNYVLAGCILRQAGQWTAYNTVLHGPLAIWPNQVGVLVADPGDLGAYAPWGRLGFVPFSVLAAVLLVRISKRAFGAKAGLAALCMWSTNPLVLAHGCLMTADMALTCTSLWTAERAWRYVTAPSLLRLVAMGVTLGLTLATKYLGLLLVPALGVVVVGALARGFAPRLLWSRRREGLVARSADAGLATLVAAAVAVLTLHTTYLWRVPGFVANKAPAGVHVAAEDAAFGPKSAELATLADTAPGRLALRLLPEPFVRGADYQRLVSQGLPTFFGDYVAPGFWSYYFVAFALKLPLCALALFALGLVTRAPPWPRALPLATIAAAGVPLFFLSGVTRLQIGVRYALPVLPFFCLVAGRGLAWLARGPSLQRSVCLIATLWLVADVTRTWPRFLPAFNTLAPRPYLWFKDSTLDWRADAPATDRDLATLVARHPRGRVVDGAQGPCFGELLVHGEQLAPRDPRDPGRIYHWLRRFWPTDSVGAWFAFAIDRDSFAAALQRDDRTAERGRVEMAIAHIGDGDRAYGTSLLKSSADPDAAAMLTAAAELGSGDEARAAAALLQMGRPDLVLARGDRAPRGARAQALLLTGHAIAAVDLLAPNKEQLAPDETYVLAAALGQCGRARDALDLLERMPAPVDPSSASLHETIVRRLREVIHASELAGRERLRR
jgi:hypothetical protein